MDLLAALKLSIPASALRDQVHAAGWEISKISFDKKRDKYEATAKHERHGEVTRNGRTEQLALSNLLLAVTRRNGTTGTKIGRWQTTFTDQLQAIAQAYAKAPIYEVKASAAFMALAHDCEHRADVLRQHLQIQMTHNPDPYPSPDKMIDDVKKRRRLEVSKVGLDHPLWSEQQQIAYRICHDVLGYVAADAGWDWQGENEAFAAHAHLLPELAQQALFTESIGQAAYASYFKAYGPAKIALLNQFVDKVQETENKRKGYPGAHPSQAFPAVALPSVEHKVESSFVEDGLGPQRGAGSLWMEERTAMAERSGYPELDQAIDAFMQMEFKSEETNENDLNRFRSPEGAHGQCEIVANAFSQYLNQRGLKAYVTTDEAKAFYPDAQDSASIGAGDFSYPEHAVVSVYLPGLAQPVEVDFTASQYGFVDFPKVQGGKLGAATPDDPTNGLVDPNAWYQSGVEPVTNGTGQTIAQQFGDPLQGEASMQNASLIDTEWAYLNQNDPQDLAKMKQAVVNAFRVVLLSPRKDLRWNAVHYQDISHVPGDESDPKAYWDALETARQNWNETRGYDRYSHIPYMKFLPSLVNIMYQRHPEDTYDDALQHAQRLIFDWRSEEEAEIMSEDEKKPEAKRRQSFQVESKVNYQLAKRLQTYVAEHKPKLDKAMTYQVKNQIAQEPLQTDQFLKAAADWADENDWGQAPSNQPDKSRYGAFMGDHLKAVAQVSQQVDTIMKAALEDVHEHDGTGHHFRSAVLQLGLPGVGPKVCSFAWLLLQPMTSQLGTIDTHILDVLGHQEKDMNNRDYFGMERELRAGLDAAGYSHIPLGVGQWAMWDYKRTGPGSHQDHSAMKILDPTPHDSIDWAAKEQPLNAQEALEHKENWRTSPPEWWGATKDARQAAWDDYQKNVALGVANNKVPYANLPMDYDEDVYQPSVAGATPWYKDPDTGKRVYGDPGSTIMQHATQTLGMSPEDVWTQLQEAAGKGYGYKWSPATS